MKIDYDVTLKGFICIPRSIIPDLVSKLGFSGFAKYLVLVSQADFDLKHKNFSKKSPPSVRNNFFKKFNFL